MIIVIDYGMGNLRSVSKALEHLGGSVKVSAEPEDIRTASKLLLPGVGAFGDGMTEINKRGLAGPIRDYAQSDRPFLGICLGLQLLFDASEESPGSAGLGILKGKVRAFRSPKVKIPHMGWNSVVLKQKHPLLSGIAENSFFYFVHTYYAVPDDAAQIAAVCHYGEEDFPAMIGRGPLFATQFHPEKSQDAGLAILKNFVELKS